MPNLYITNNNTKTVMGLTPEKKTTPSLVVTCGTTTYYGSLTTDIKQATEPNKIVVTSGSTTYYTMAPALGTKYVNFITPTECKAIDGTVMAKCCSGIAGYKDRTKSNFCSVTKFDYGSIGPSTLGSISSGCVKALVYNSPDTTISHCNLYYPPLGHTHNTSVVFDSDIYYGCMDVNTRHKGVRVCNNYNTSPDFIYVGCGLASVTRGNLNYDFLYINRGDNNIPRSIACMPFSCNNGGTWPSGNVSLVESTGTESLEFSDIATGPINTAVGLDISRDFSVTHTHFADIPYDNTYDYLIGCYCAGWGMPWFGVNMKCYDNDIDKLPQGSILFTDCDISCFNSKCWDKIDLSKSLQFDIQGTTQNMYYETFPYVNGTFNKDYNINFQLCWKPSNYNRSRARYKVDYFVGVGMWPNTCTGSVGSCTYVPILDTWHYHTVPKGELYVCVKTVAPQNFIYFKNVVVGWDIIDVPGGLPICVPRTELMPFTCTMDAPANYMSISIASPGCYAICHK